MSAQGGNDLIALWSIGHWRRCNRWRRLLKGRSLNTGNVVRARFYTCNIHALRQNGLMVLEFVFRRTYPREEIGFPVNHAQGQDLLIAGCKRDELVDTDFE